MEIVGSVESIALNYTWNSPVLAKLFHSRYRTSFGPTIDGRSVLPQEPEVLLKDQCCDPSFTFPDLMIGVARDEGEIYY